MIGYVVRRLFVSIPVVLMSSFAVFCLVAVSGDPLRHLREQSGIDAEAIAAREVALGLDKPIPVRYLEWFGGVVRGDFGVALDGEPVLAKLTRAFGVTMRMVVAAALIALVVAIVLGVIAAVRQYTPIDYATTFFAFVFFSMPVFFLAGILKDVAIRINELTGRTIFSTVGERSPTPVDGLLPTVLDRLGHMALPTMTLVLITLAAWSRYQRASMLDVLSADYIRTARAKGVGERKVIFKHGLRNALIPLTAVAAVDFASLVNGSIIVETVFAWNGLGRLFIEALNTGDVYVASAWLFIAAGAVIVFNIVADIIYGLLDPRIRHA